MTYIHSLPQTIQNHGIQGIELPKESVVNIAGMGGKSIIQILSQGSLSCSLLLLQPNDHVHLVRSFLWSIGWGIVESSCIQEKGQFYFALAARYGEGYLSGTEEDQWLCPILRRAPTAAWRNWIQFRDSVLTKAYVQSKGKLAGAALTEYTLLRNLNLSVESHLR